MDAETQKKIEEVVIEILRCADMEEMTEYKLRNLAADRLGIDLSHPDRKSFVRRVVESFLASNQEDVVEAKQEEQQEVAAEEGEEEDEAGEGDRTRKRGEKEYDDEGDLIVCKLTNKRRVTIQEFRGKTLVSIREYYNKDGKQFPTSKGILPLILFQCFTPISLVSGLCTAMLSNLKELFFVCILVMSY
ncbi:hypothetical protein HPP92_027041 [Vanilla planifolia]|uniref:DEK-C domain-containing protein n=1 Tax=Vanilla planifolia TaxID=51239 RepID=A0A835PGH1_VANPL|nr:hypothetical protein HPP92_027159 [Vanilla planifolia]KAG0449911.1 hypothetical protein HPP92_027041 [Vanilla planifolia]